MLGFSATPDRVITFSRVSGTISLKPGLGVFNGPDGNASGPTDISSFGGLAGIRSDSSGFLTGVFLGPTMGTSRSWIPLLVCDPSRKQLLLAVIKPESLPRIPATSPGPLHSALSFRVTVQFAQRF